MGYDAWITAIRADQSAHRGAASVVGPDRKFGLLKVNPLLNWTRRDVWAFIATHNVPYNPLHDQGYASIGCWPCTRATAAGDDERADGGRDMRRRSAGCTRLIAVFFELTAAIIGL